MRLRKAATIEQVRDARTTVAGDPGRLSRSEAQKLREDAAPVLEPEADLEPRRAAETLLRGGEREQVAVVARETEAAVRAARRAGHGREARHAALGGQDRGPLDRGAVGAVEAALEDAVVQDGAEIAGEDEERGPDLGPRDLLDPGVGRSHPVPVAAPVSASESASLSPRAEFSRSATSARSTFRPRVREGEDGEGLGHDLLPFVARRDLGRLPTGLRTLVRLRGAEAVAVRHPRPPGRANTARALASSGAAIVRSVVDLPHPRGAHEHGELANDDLEVDAVHRRARTGALGEPAWCHRCHRRLSFAAGP